MTNNQIRIQPPQLSLEQREHLLLILADYKLLVFALSPELPQEQSTRNPLILNRLRLHLILLTEEVTDSVDVQLVHTVSIEQSLYLHL